MKIRLLLLKTICHAFAAVPLRAALAVGRGLGIIAACIVRHRRRETVERIQRCFPKKSRAECEAIYRGMFRNLGMNIVEMLRLSVLGTDDLLPRVEFHGQENLHEALRSDGWGSLALMAHIGNWEFCGAVASLLEEQVSAVVKPMRNPVLQEYLKRTRERMGGSLLPHHNSFKECLRRLKAGSHIAVILDQNRSREQGVFVEFFGQPACTSPGLALLSAQSGSSVLPLFDIRDADPTRHHLHLLPAIPPCSGRKIEALTEATQIYTQRIEEMIRKYPEQWIWLHRRWKTKPPAPEASEP